MTGLRWDLNHVGFILIAACLGIVQFSIASAQILFTLAAFAWLVVIVRSGERPVVPSFFWPLALYALLTLVSAALSVDPRASFIDSRQLLLWLMVPIVARFCVGERARTVIDVVIALGAAGAVVGIVQYTLMGKTDLSNRPTGPLSHYMTYSGVLMLVTCATVARLLFDRREWIWPAIAVPALVVALGFTFARNAWVGVFLAVICLLGLKNWKLIVLAPVLGVLLYFAAPAGIKQRILSVVDMNDPTNRDRRAMMQVGVGMVRDHPFFGVGPEMVMREYPKYRPATYVNAVNPHLHNVPMQIAAERGLPALAAWLWFVVEAFRYLFREFKRGRHPAVAAAGLAAMVAMLTAGLLEYNFGDSEFLMLFLGLITLPYAAARTEALRLHAGGPARASSPAARAPQVRVGPVA